MKAQLLYFIKAFFKYVHMYWFVTTCLQFSVRIKTQIFL